MSADQSSSEVLDQSAGVFYSQAMAENESVPRKFTRFINKSPVEVRFLTVSPSSNHSHRFSVATDASHDERVPDIHTTYEKILLEGCRNEAEIGTDELVYIEKIIVTGAIVNSVLQLELSKVERPKHSRCIIL